MIDNNFELTKLLGRGGSSKVFLARDDQQRLVAIKTMRKDKNYSQSAVETLVNREAEMLQNLDGHPNIIRWLDSKLDGSLVVGEKSEKVMYNVLEYAENGAFSAYVRSTGPIEEEISRLYVLQIWNAISHMHSLGYAHLDIKLENILLDEFFNAKLADLGSWIEATDFDTMVDRRRGTLQYMAPEVAKLQPGESYRAIPADIYSLGISIYVMITGEFPSEQQIQSNFMTTDSDMKTSYEMDVDSEEVRSKWDLVSPELKILLQAMIHPDPCKRPSIFEVLSYSWLSRDFGQEMVQEAYQEMSSRKAYIKSLYAPVNNL